MKEIIKQILENEIEQLENNPLYNSLSDYDRGYLDGEHDHCVSLLDKFEIKHNHKYIGTGYDN